MLTLLMLALSDPAAASSTANTSRDLVVVSASRADTQRCGDPLMQARQGGAGAMTLDRSLDDGQAGDQGRSVPGGKRNEQGSRAARSPKAHVGRVREY